MADLARDRLRLVSSRQNALVKDLRRAFQHSELTDDGHAAIEGVKMVEEAIRSGLRLKAVFFSESGRNRADKLLPQISSHAETLLLPDEVFESAVATETPQGVAALVKWKPVELESVLQVADPLVVVCGGLQDPGNLGTIIRSAEAFGAAGVLLGEGTVSEINAKAVRASAGSVFRMAVAHVSQADLQGLGKRGIRVLGTSSHKGEFIHEADLTGGVAIAIGSEGAGVPKSYANVISGWVRIPQKSEVESLNAGVAASVVLYECYRQRGGKSTTESQSDFRLKI